MSAEPETDGRKLDEGKIVGGEFVVAGGDTSALLDLVEEPLDQITVAVKLGTEADRVFAVALGWDIRPRAPFGDKCPDPVRVVAAICQQLRSPG